MAIEGIKSVDFIIEATGEGVVNHNGAFSVYNPAAGKMVDNHLYPKLRGLDPLQRLADSEGGGSRSMRLDDPAIARATLIVSAECIRSHLFRDVSFGINQVTTQNVARSLASLHGLVRGYLITEGDRNFARKSCLFVTDFECTNPELAFNQATNSKVRGTANEKTSMYSYFRTGKDLQYTAKATLSIEDLQYIPMENSLGRSAFDYQVSVATGKQVAAGITQFLLDIAPPESSLKPEAQFVTQVMRVGSISDVGDAGILLNDDAMRVVIAQVRSLLEGLFIRQGKGYLQVTKVVTDFNDSVRVFRAQADPSFAIDSDVGAFAHYYAQQPLSDEAFEAAQQLLATEAAERKADKAKSRGKKGAKKKQDAAPTEPA